VRLELVADADAVALAAAEFIAAEARAAVLERGHFTLALSGGKTPWQMLRLLGQQQLPWAAVQVFQVDERIAPAGHPDRNLTHLNESLQSHSPLRPNQVHAMPVEAADLQVAAKAYARTLEAFTGNPPRLDLVHLGLGPDGHTASLVPGDPVLDVREQDVALSGVYQGRNRMTLTFPMLNRARRVLWLVNGGDKAPMLKRLLAKDETIPAGRVRQEHAVLLADQAAAGGLQVPTP
jgi:6-phosphogluconolactonase